VLYEKALVALIDVLGSSGEVYWQRWLRDDLRVWRAAGETGHHRQAYGGMGSFNDRALGDDPWLDAAIIQLVNIASSTARVAEQEPERFVQVSSSAVTQLQVYWYRCTACGREYTKEWELQCAAAQGWASWVIPRLITEGSIASVGSVLLVAVRDVPGRPYVHHVERRAAELGLRHHESGSSTPCPSCGNMQWRYTSSSAF
jgi:predicted RNA-binding Zn-ribbon protein involved in translation (DUF1610 family)